MVAKDALPTGRTFRASTAGMTRTANSTSTRTRPTMPMTSGRRLSSGTARDRF
jgi:hypothetical protein